MSNLEELATLFRQTNDHMNPTARQEAEARLRQFELQGGFGISLLELIAKVPDETVQLLATIYFKNFIKRNWPISDDGQKLIQDRDRHEIKLAVVDMMLKAPSKIKRQLSAAITLIAAQDFPESWQDLLPLLTQRLETQDDVLMFGVLEIIESITQRYLNVTVNEQTHSHIRYIMATFIQMWLKLLKNLSDAIQHGLKTTRKDQNRALKFKIQSATLLVRICFDLHTVDIIDWFEDNMHAWIPIFLNFLTLEDAGNVLNAPEDGPGELEKLRTEVMKVMVLYNTRYEEQYRAHVPSFVATTCELVSRLNKSGRFDELASFSIKYLTSVSKQRWHKDLFDRSKINALMQHIIIPNIELRDSDLAMYEMEGDAYVRRDLEGSDLETRRRGASDFINGLCAHFEDDMTMIIVDHVARLIQEYKTDPERKFLAKDAAITLILAVAVKGKTRLEGATLLNEKVDVPTFFQQNIMPCLQRQENCHPLIFADCIKFLMMFRSIWDDGTFTQLLGLLVSFLSSEDYVLHTYAACAIDKVLSLMVGEPQSRRYRFPKAQLVEHLSDTINPLLHIVTAVPDSFSNAHVMRTILRVIIRSEEALVSVIDVLLQQLTVVLQRICSKPQTPDFNHLVFELIAASITSICRRDSSKAAVFEERLSEGLFSILGNEKISEFHPYVYQLLALLLRVQPEVPDHYAKLFDKLLFPPLWSQEGNIRAISGMFGDYLSRIDVPKFVNDKRLEGMLGIFQKLISERGHDYHAFTILRSVFEFVPATRLMSAGYLRTVLKLCFVRLQQGKRLELCTNFIVCLGVLGVKNGPEALLAGMDQVQPGIFGMVLQSVWMEYARKINSLSHRKIVTFCMVQMLGCDKFWAEGYLKEFIPTLFSKTIEIFEADPEEHKKSKEDYLEDLAAQGCDAKFSQLKFAFAPERDVTASMGDPREALVRVMVPKLEANTHLCAQLKATVDNLHVTQFNSYCQRASVAFRM